jgi:hypothetical protein
MRPSSISTRTIRTTAGSWWSSRNHLEATVHERQADGSWAEPQLTHASQILSFGEIGEVCSVGELYRNTNLVAARGLDKAEAV